MPTAGAVETVPDHPLTEAAEGAPPAGPPLPEPGAPPDEPDPYVVVAWNLGRGGS